TSHYSYTLLFFFLIIPRPPRSTLFPYTTLSDLFRDRLAKGETLDDILPEAFAVVRDAARRTLGQRHFDVQLMGAMALHKGHIARSEEHTSELQSRGHLVCRLRLEKKKIEYIALR